MRWQVWPLVLQVVVIIGQSCTEVSMIEDTLLPTQASRKSHGPYVPQSVSAAHVAGALVSCGKYLSPMPSPAAADPGSVKNAFIAVLTASHLLVPALVASFIDFDVSITM